jgi:predicted amidohydrolase YtcJ
MLILGAELESGARGDVRIERGVITAIGALQPDGAEPVFEAEGGLLLPGLHDHHIHIAALAASLASVPCGPPQVHDADALAAALGVPGSGWLRGIGYHESVAGLLDRSMLDRIVPDRPLRIQHRGGRMWFLNSAAIDMLLTGNAAPPGLDLRTGQLFEEDAWLKTAMGSQPPCFAEAGAMLARHGVTGVTEISPANDPAIARHIAAQRAAGHLQQKVLLAGKRSLSHADMSPGVTLGPIKLHLHEEHLPPLDEAIALMRDAHDRGRAVAVHCATEVELVYTLAALDEAGAAPGDRIEHASIAPDSAVAEIARLGLAVVSQPHFIAERGDAYVRDVPAADQPLLYRLRAFLDAGVALAGGSDAPFGGTNPWASMSAAVSRRIDPKEELTPEEALDLYLRAPEDLARRRRVEIGAPADLCLLDRGWANARADLASVAVRAAWIDGRSIFDSVDQAPVERG